MFSAFPLDQRPCILRSIAEVNALLFVRKRNVNGCAVGAMAGNFSPRAPTRISLASAQYWPDDPASYSTARTRFIVPVKRSKICGKSVMFRRRYPAHLHLFIFHADAGHGVISPVGCAAARWSEIVEYLQPCVRDRP